MHTPTNNWSAMIQEYQLKRIARSHANTIQGRRHEKGRGKGVGAILVNSHVKPQVPIEKFVR